MLIRTINARGQIALGMDVLAHMDVQPSDRLNVDLRPNGVIRLKGEKPAARPAGDISDIFGLLKQEGEPSLSIEEMNEISGPPDEI